VGYVYSSGMLAVNVIAFCEQI